jgi:ribosomal silencing factor RsfS
LCDEALPKHLLKEHHSDLGQRLSKYLQLLNLRKSSFWLYAQTTRSVEIAQILNAFHFYVVVSARANRHFKANPAQHLDHLIEQKLVKKKVEGFQNVSYGLTEEIYSLIHVSQEDIAEWLEVLEQDEDLPAKLKSMKFDMNAYYRKMTEKQMDQETDRDLDDTLALSLFELKNLIGYDLKIDRKESDADFWEFIGNPLYRMHERAIAEKCRTSDRYKEKPFEKMKTLMNELRGHKFLRKP